MTEQIGLHISMTANMSVVTAQMQALTAGVMETTAAYRMLDRSMDSIKFQDANRQFSNLLTSSGQFNARMVTLQTSTEGYGKALEAGRVSGRKLWGESLAYVRKQSGEIRSLAREQVAFSRSQMMMTGRLASGAATATVFTPAGIGKDQVSQMQLANKQWEIFNRNAQLGSTAMVNWGKNTQWAGRQLMVGFTIPLMIMGGMAAKTFKELDQELVRLQKVYGSGLTFGEDFKKQSEMIREEGKRMASELAAAYGQAGTETVALMADLAAAGYEGENLTKLTTATTKLSLLGEIDKQEAMKATISLQTAFGLSTDQVAEKVVFLNAVENQTSTSLQDLVEAIPRAGTVIEGLGGSVEDLALYMTAFREGGVSAAEGANALKSGLSSIIAPPKAAVEFMQEFGINLPKMVKANAGDLTGTLMAFQTELQKLDDLAQQQVITKLFGKYQFARMNAFFNNLGAKGSQTQKVLELMGYTTEQLGQIAEQELESITESISGKFNRSWQSFKVNLAEVGEVFLKVGTVALDIFNKVFGFFEGKDVLRNIVLGLAGVAAVIGPIIMSMGLFGNMLGMMIKGILRLTNAFKVMGSGGGIKRSFELLTAESMASNASIDALTNNMFDQQKADAVLADANKWLAETYDQIANSAARAATAVGNAADRMRGGMMVPPGQVGAAMPLSYTRGQHGPQLAGIPMQYGHHMPLTADARQQEIIRRVFTQPGGITGTSWPAGLESLGDKERPYLGGVLGGSAISAYGNKTGGSQIQYFSDLNISDADKFMNANEMRYSKVNSGEFFAEKSALMQSELGVSTAEAEAWVERWTAHLRELDQSTMTLSQAQELTVMSLRDAENVVEKSTGTTSYTGRSGGKTRGLASGPDEKLGQRPEQIGILGGSPGNSVLEEDRRVWRETADSVAATSEQFDSVGVAADVASGELAALDTSGAVGGLETLEVQTKQAAADIKRVAVGSQEQTANVTAFNKAWSSNAKGATNAFIATTAQQKAMTASMSKMTGEFTQTSMTFDKIQTAGTMYIAAFDKATGQLIGMRGFDKNGNVTASISPQAREQAAALEAKKMAAAAQAAADELVVGAKQAGRELVGAAKTAGGIEVASEKAGGQADMAAEAMGGAVGGGGLINKYKTAGKFANISGGASMMLPMAGMMMAPQGSSVQAVSQMASMGSMAGMFGGPWGMAAGTAAGAAVGIWTEALQAINNKSKETIKEVTDGWIAVSSAAGVQISKNMAEAFDVEKYKPEGMYVDNLSEIIPLDELENSSVKATQKFIDTVSEQFADQIEAMSKASAENAADAAIVLYDNLVMSGFSPEKAATIVKTALLEADQGGIVLDVSAKITNITTSKAAAEQAAVTIQSQINNQLSGLDAVGTEVPAFLYTIPFSAPITAISDWWLNKDNQGETESIIRGAGEANGELYRRSVEKGMTPDEQADKFWSSMMPNMSELARRNELDWARETSAVMPFYDDSGNITSQESLQDKFGLTGDMKSDLETIFGQWGADSRQAFFKAISEGGKTQFIDFYNQARIYLGGAGRAAAAGFKEGSWAQLRFLELINQGILGSRAYTMVLYELASSLSDVGRNANAMADALPAAFDAVTIENISDLQEDMDKLKKEQEKEEKRAQKQADNQKDAIADQKDALSERQDLINEQIQSIEDQYDKEINKIQEAEDARQKAFEKEQERFARRQEMRNMEISYQEAVAEGNLFEAARIRMDISATRNQYSAEDENEKAAAQSEKKVKALEKERDAEVKVLQAKLDSIDKQMEALDDQEKAIDDHLESIQDAHAAELKSLRETYNAERAEARELMSDLERIWGGGMATIRQRIRESMNVVGELTKSQANAFINTWEKTFGEFTPVARKELLADLQGGDWRAVYKALAEVIGIPASQLNGLWNLINSGVQLSQAPNGNVVVGSDRGNESRGGISAADQDRNSVTGGQATGGYISGPGGPTTDSIPAWLSNGEYVVRASSVQKYGKSFLDMINGGDAVPQFDGGTGTFAGGGMIGAAMGSFKGAQMGLTLSNLMSALLLSSVGKSGTGTSSAGAPSAVSLSGISNEARRAIVQFAIDQLGEEYVLGATGPNSWDCSGLTMMAYALAGKSIPRLASQQWAASKRINTNDALPGDLAFFNPGNNSAGPGTPGHVALMTGRDTFIHAAKPSLGVLRGSLSTTGNDFMGIGRIPGLRNGGRINYDNTLANLHRGETVLTAPLTSKLEQAVAGAGNAEYNINVTINNPSDEIDIERALLNVMSKNERRMGRNRVVG